MRLCTTAFVGGLAALAAGCTDDSTPVSPGTLAFVDGPEVRANENGALLAAWLDATTSLPAMLTATVDDGETIRQLGPWTAEEIHEHLMLGFYASTDHTIVVTAESDDGQVVTSDPLSYTSRAVPMCEGADPNPDTCFPEFTVVTSDPDTMEPGVTMVGLGRFLIMVDHTGRPVWVYDTGASMQSGDMNPGGTIAIVYDRDRIQEIDLSGRLLGEWRAAGTFDEPASATPVDTLAMHHDVVAMPDGGWLTLSVELRTIDDYPTSETDPDADRESTLVAGDVAVHFARDGSIVQEYSMLDLLDPTRIGYGSVAGTFWDAFFGERIADWSHANAVWYDEPSDEVVVSLRQQDAVVAVNATSGELSWILAPPDNWSPGPWTDALLTSADPVPMGEPGQPYHQHGVKVSAAGNVMIFDNGNNRKSPFQGAVIADENNVSRGMEVEIDRERMMWRTTFAYGTELGLYAGTLGDVDPLPITDNVLITYGNLNEVDQGSRVIEVNRDGEVVFDVFAPEPWLNTRSQRLDVIPGR